MGPYAIETMWYVAAQSWQIAFLTIVVGVATFALRRRGAHVRYLLWLIVVAKCLVPPLYAVPLRVFPLPPPVWESNHVAIPGPLHAYPLAELVDEATLLARDAQSNALAPTGAPPALSPRGRAMAIVWLAGASACLTLNVLRASRGHYRLRKTRRPLPAPAHAQTAALLRACDLRRLPPVWLVEGVGQPFVWGWLRGSIYVPPSFLALENPEYRRDILAHELSHVLRFDAGVNLLQILAQSLFWFHPCVWWANRQIRREREKCCDEMVLARLHTSPKNYSAAILETLVRARESAQGTPSLAITGRRKSTQARIRTMLMPGRRFHARPSVAVGVMVVALALTIVPTTLALAWATPKPIALPLPLASLPHTCNSWSGRDLPLPQVKGECLRASHADDFLYRRYENEAAHQWADLEVGYWSAWPAGIMMGQEPTV